MDSKRANLAFLITMILDATVSLGVSYLFPAVAENLVLGNLVCELVILLPGILFVLLSGEKFTEIMGFRKMKFTTVLAIIPFTMFTSPFITLLNLLSQFFTDNTAAQMVTDYRMDQMPFWQMFLTIAIFAPFCEELVCRGVYYQSYKKSSGAWKAMLLSALIFALIHLNINQAVYAFGMGILAALLVEAAGSLWASVVYHGLLNGSQVVLMYVMMKMDPQAYSRSSMDMITTDMLVYSVTVYLVIAAICLPLGWALLVWMSGHEGRRGVLLQVWQDKKKKDKIISVSLILALILCVCLMMLPSLMEYIVG